MEERSVESYYHEVFPALLKLYTRKRPDNDCPHHGVPFSRAVWIDSARHPLNTEPAFRDSYFWLAWYCHTLLDQVIFAHFPDHNAEWLENKGARPLPMRDVGEGCLRVCRASNLLTHVCELNDIAFEPYDIRRFQELFEHQILQALPKKAGISPDDFLHECRAQRIELFHVDHHRRGRGR